MGFIIISPKTFSWLANVDEMKDPWYSSTVWLLSAQT